MLLDEIVIVSQPEAVGNFLQFSGWDSGLAFLYRQAAAVLFLAGRQVYLTGSKVVCPYSSTGTGLRTLAGKRGDVGVAQVSVCNVVRHWQGLPVRYSFLV